MGPTDIVRQRTGPAEIRHEVLGDDATWEVSHSLPMAILNALAAHVALVDSQGIIVATNEAWNRFESENVEAPRGCGRGTNYFEVCERAAGADSSEASAVAAGLRSVLTGEAERFSLEYPCHSPTRKRWFLLTVTLLNATGPRRAVVMHTNITERIRAEQTIRESEERFRASFEQGAVGMAHVSLGGLFLRVNDKFCETLGYSRSDLIGESFSTLTETYEISQVKLCGDGSLGPPTDYSEERHCRTAHGADLWLRIARTMIRENNGSSHYSNWVIEDISATKKADLSFKLLHRMYAILSKIGEVIVRASDPHELYQAVCEILVRDGVLPAALVALLGPPPGGAQIVASAGASTFLAKDLVTEIDLDLSRLGPLGSALKKRSHFVCSQMSNDPSMVRWVDMTNRSGFRNLAAFPVLIEGDAIGALLLFAKESDHFQIDELGLMDSIVSDLSFAIGAMQKDAARQRAEAKLRRSQAMAATAAQMANLGTWDYDPYADRLEWSDETIRIFGISHSEFPGTRTGFLRFVHPEDLERVSAMGSARETGDPYVEGEYRIVRGDGSVRHVYERSTWILDEHGKLARAAGVLMDITDRRVADETIRESEARYREVFNQQFQFMAILSSEGRVLEANALSMRIAGVDRTDIIGRYIWETPMSRNLPEVREKWKNLLNWAALSPEPVVVEALIDIKGGEVRQIELALKATKDSRGEVGYYIAQAVDITDRKLGEQKILEREALLRIAGRTARLGGWSVALPGLELRWSDELCQIHDVPVDAVPDLEGAFEFYVPEWRSVIQAAFFRCAEEGMPFDLEAEIITALGRRIWVRVAGERNTTGTQVHGALQDITEKKKAEAEVRELERAEEATRAKSAFLAHMSHEIRTPMNGVIGMTDVLYQTQLEPPQIEMLDLIRDSAISLLGIIDDILDFSKIEAGKLELDVAPMPLAGVLERVCEMEEHTATRTGVELTLFTDPKMPAEVLGDAIRVRQVLVNLINNAIKFSGDERRVGEVSVRATLIDESADSVTIEFRVTDNGIGMGEETLSRLFTSFTQADASTTRRFGGTGLGLVISSNLVKLMGGQINVQSALGSGSTFTVCLTFLRSPGQSDQGNPYLFLEGLDCLLIGEHIGMTDDLSIYLTHSGARVERAQDVAGALECFNLPESGPWVWIIVGRTETSTLRELRDFAHAHPTQRLGFVLVGRGAYRNELVNEQGLVFIDSHVLTRRTFLSAVAIAGGRAEPVQRTTWEGTMASSGTSSELVERRGQGRLILLAEDHITNQRVILRQLHLLGYSVHVASTGRQALEQWRTRKYELLVTDLQMPEMDGYELARAIRLEEGAGERIPIVGLTATALEGEMGRCLAAGMDDYLTKPARLAALQKALEKWLPPSGIPPPNRATAVFNPEHTSRPVNLDVLAAVVGDDPLVIRGFVEDFRAAAAKAALDLGDACRIEDGPAAGNFAHKLKSSARTVGAFRLGEICESIERAARTGGAVGLSALYASFQAEIALVFEYLDSTKEVSI